MPIQNITVPIFHKPKGKQAKHLEDLIAKRMEADAVFADVQRQHHETHQRIASLSAALRTACAQSDAHAALGKHATGTAPDVDAIASQLAEAEAAVLDLPSLDHAREVHRRVLHELDRAIAELVHVDETDPRSLNPELAAELDAEGARVCEAIEGKLAEVAEVCGDWTRLNQAWSRLLGPVPALDGSHLTAWDEGDRVRVALDAIGDVPRPGIRAQARATLDVTYRDEFGDVAERESVTLVRHARP